MKSPVILKIFKNHHLIEVKQFENNQILLGHEADVSVDLADESVSPIHCLIEQRDTRYYLCDLGSATGTKKNGQIVLDEQISSGDQIEVGPFSIQFFAGLPKPERAPVRSFTPAKANIPTQPPVLKSESVPKAEAQIAKSFVKSKKRGSTFAPESEIKDLASYLKPTTGTVVEVIVAWQERILSTHHFGADHKVTIGSSKKATISIPPQFIQGDLPFLDLKSGCCVLLQGDMTFEITDGSQNQLGNEKKLGESVNQRTANVVRLKQGELLRLTMGHGVLQIYVRYVPNTIKPVLRASVDFSSMELTGLVLSLALVALTDLRLSIFAPPAAEEKPEERVRLAQFVYNRPTIPPVEKLEPSKPIEHEPPFPVEPKKIQLDEMKKEVLQKSNHPTAQAQQMEAKKAPLARPSESKRSNNQITSVLKEGAAIKITKNKSANAKSKEINHLGLLGAFNNNGVRTQLDQAYSGHGELMGLADKATGQSGDSENRDGHDIGSKFKSVGPGGTGTSTYGIKDIGTRGTHDGDSNYGNEGHLGGKGNVSLDPGNADEKWEGTIDREAVRRVIRQILPQIKSCYERQLRMNSGLEGRVVVEFEITGQGLVRRTKTLSSSLNDTTVESCIAARIRDARFPQPPAGTIAVIDYPFLFGAQNKSAPVFLRGMITV